jgi:hypothetical protein
VMTMDCCISARIVRWMAWSVWQMHASANAISRPRPTHLVVCVRRGFV